MNIAAYPEQVCDQVTPFDWIGAIPAHWSVKQMKHLLSQPLKYGANEEARECVDGDPRYIRITDFGSDGRLRAETKRTLPSKIANEYLLKAGDILLARSGATVGKAFLFQEREEACFAGYLIMVRCDASQCSYSFLNYYLRSSSFEHWKEMIFSKATIQNISAEKYGSLIAPFPPLHEQHAIAAFLDGKCATIDEAVRIKEEQIRLLAERRQILIQQAVTRGLNRDAHMKDSGIDWIGQIPAHWDAIPLKRLFRERNERTKTGEEMLLSLRMVEGLVPHDDVSDKAISDDDLIDYKKVYPGQMVMNRMRASIGLFGIAGQPGLVSPDYAIFDMRDDLYGPFYLNLFKIDQMGTRFRLSSRGLGTGSSGFMRLYTDDFGAISVPVPSSKEQRDIVNYVAGIEDKIGGAIALKQSQIATLREYRVSLINAAVTGKIKVI